MMVASKIEPAVELLMGAFISSLLGGSIMAEIANLTVTGMKCGGCEATLTGKLSALSGVLGVKAFHKENRVEVEFEQQTISVEQIGDAISDAGFDVD